MGTTPRGIPYPEPSELVTNGAAAMQALADAVDDEFDTSAAALAAVSAQLGDLIVQAQHISAYVDPTGYFTWTYPTPFPNETLFVWCVQGGDPGNYGNIGPHRVWPHPTADHATISCSAAGLTNVDFFMCAVGR